MQRKTLLLHIIFITLTFCFLSCSKTPEQIPKKTPAKPVVLDQINSMNLSGIRLGDGVPLSLNLSIRWNIENPETFFKQFSSSDSFCSSIMQPRILEIMNSVANEFPSVDSVFSSQRQEFIAEVKNVLVDYLSEDEISVKEVIVSGISFPNSYTVAMEQAGLQRQELERIEQLNIIDIAQAEANRKKAEAESKVAIAQAEADGRVQKIQAQTEKDRRLIELAKAETQSQIDKKNAETEATRLKLLAKADLEKRTDLKNLEIQKQRDLMELDLDKQRKFDVADMERQMEMAKVYQANPVYASFLVNKELASKVEIAVLPTGSDPSVFGNLLNNTINNK